MLLEKGIIFSHFGSKIWCILNLQMATETYLKVSCKMHAFTPEYRSLSTPGTIPGAGDTIHQGLPCFLNSHGDYIQIDLQIFHQ